VHADGEIVLPSGEAFMPTAKTFCRRAKRACRWRRRFAVEQSVHADGVSVSPLIFGKKTSSIK
jgi:hypothetical protein